MTKTTKKRTEEEVLEVAQPLVEEEAVIAPLPTLPVEKVVKRVGGVQIDVTPARKAVPGKRYSFTQWAVRRAVKTRHQPGMRAFVQNPSKSRTLEEWDSLFETY